MIYGVFSVICLCCEVFYLGLSFASQCCGVNSELNNNGHSKIRTLRDFLSCSRVTLFYFIFCLPLSPDDLSTFGSDALGLIGAARWRPLVVQCWQLNCRTWGHCPHSECYVRRFRLAFIKAAMAAVQISIGSRGFRNHNELMAGYLGIMVLPRSSLRLNNTLLLITLQQRAN